MSTDPTTVVADWTDALNRPAYEAVGPEGCERLLELGATIATALVDDGGSAFASLLPDD